MKWRYYSFAFFLLITLKGFCIYDSLAMDKFIAAHITNSISPDVFVNVSDSLDHISKTEEKRFIFQVIYKAKDVKNKYIEALSKNTLGLWYLRHNLFSDAYNSFNGALAIFKEIDNKSGIFTVTSNIGILYYYMGQFKKALITDLQALSIVKSNNDIPFKYAKSTNICLNLGGIYGELKNLPLAREYFKRALNYYQLDPDKDSITRAFIYNNLSDSYVTEGEVGKAEVYFKVAFDIKLKYGDNEDKIDAYLHAATINKMKENYPEAKNMMLKALSYNDTTVITEDLRKCYQALAEIYEKLNDQKNENKFLKLKYKTKLFLDSIGRASEISDIEMKNEYRQQTVNDSIQNKIQLKIRDVKLEQKKRESVYGVVALIIMSIVAFLFFKRYRLTQKQKLLIEEQKQLVEEKNHEITDSINYAKNLQDALIPDPSELFELFSEAFVLYFPKDIVAGDFYWWHHFSSGKKILIAAADCTGHGVPGAMVSVVCINALNRAVNEFKLTEPNEILDKVNLIVNETFGKNNKQVSDGMDISLLLVDHTKKEVRWSGANNKLIYFKNNEALIVKADKQPIGKNENSRPFTLNTLPYAEGSVFYLLTDGFSDQFGGDKIKKLGFSQLKKIMEMNYDKPLKEQKINFEKIFKEWKNKSEQTDDVSLIGIKL